MKFPEGIDHARWQICVSLARDLLLVADDGTDLVERYRRVLIDDGLPQTGRPLRVLIVGAGIAGLTAGHLLKQAGHDVRLIEANTKRIGGRIKTFRNDPDRGMISPFQDPAQYAEAGAMRIPDNHVLSLSLIDKFGLRRRPFRNVDVDPATGAPAGRTWIDVNGIKLRRADYAADPRPINESFSLGVPLLRTASDSYDLALATAHDYYSRRTADGREDLPIEERVQGWARLIYDMDHLSMSQFLTQIAGLGVGAVDAIGTLENITSRLPLAFIHSFLARSMINPGARFWELEGGSWHLPYAFEPLLADSISFDRRVTAIHQDAAAQHVVITAKTEDGGTEQRFEGDVAVITVPFSSLRHVTIEPLLPYPKRRAIIELHYDSATKVLLEFTRRWWEFSEDDWKRELEAQRPGLYDQYGPGEGDQIFGGGSVTDNPNRFVYYPSRPVPGSPGGVVLASYTWADDARRWDSMDDHDRYAYALRGLQDLHGDRIEAFWTGRGATQSWSRDDYAFGEAAVFAPGQFTEHHPVISQTEGVLHFAGEHTSLKHSWIEGAIESAVRVALEINER
ncbi:flavin monoamine oxidase family protein [Actinoplanes sp. NPDC000266]